MTQRLTIAVMTIACLAGFSAQAQDVCVVCSGPEATYRCVVEKSGKINKLGALGEKALHHVCAKELARTAGHATCSVRRDATAAACADGILKEISLASLLEGGEPPAAPAPVVGPPVSGPAVSGPPVSGSQVGGSPGSGAPGTGTQVAGPPSPDAKPGPPRTVQEMAERAGEKSKQQLKDVGTSVGTTAERTWTCLSSFFKKC